MQSRSFFPESDIDLTGRDLLEAEAFVADAIRDFLPFADYSLALPAHLPRELKDAGGAAVWLPEGRRALLPLVSEGRFLGVFTARGVKPRPAKAALPHLARLAALILDGLLIRKRAITDPLTGALTARAFLAESAGRLAAVRERAPGLMSALDMNGGASQRAALVRPDDSAGWETPDRLARVAPGCMGALVLEIDQLAWVVERFGAERGEEVLAATAQALRDSAARLAMPAAVFGRLDMDPFGAYGNRRDLLAAALPSAAAPACAVLAEAVRRAMAAHVFEHPLSGERFSVTVGAGHAAYPKDFTGRDFTGHDPYGRDADRSPEVLFRALLSKARLALERAREIGRGANLSFAGALAEGGGVLRGLPLGRVLVGLGRELGARPGMRFLVWGGRAPEQGPGGPDPGGSPTRYVAEIVLTDVRTEAAVAETLWLADPSRPPAPGDRLRLSDEAAGPSLDRLRPAPEGDRKQADGGALGYREFLEVAARVARSSENKSVSAALIRIPGIQDVAWEGFDQLSSSSRRGPDDGIGGIGGCGESGTPDPLEALAAALREALGPGGVVGRYGLGGLAAVAPGVDGPRLLERLTVLPFDQGRAAVGVAQWPFLDFPRAALLDMAGMALDHALLLAASPDASTPSDESGQPVQPSPSGRSGEMGETGAVTALFGSVSLNVHADRLFATGDLYQAMQAYERALLADETNHLARMSLGVCLARLGRLDSARKQFEAASMARPDDASAAYNLGHAWFKLGERDQARRAFQACLAIEPDNVFALLRLGRMALDAGEAGEAKALLERARGLPGGKAPALRDLARLALAGNDLDAARDLLHQALLADPQDARSAHLLAVLALDAGDDPELAETLARQSVALQPEVPAHWAALARALKALGRADEAGEALARAGQEAF